MKNMEDQSRNVLLSQIMKEDLEVEGCSFKPQIFTKNSRFYKKEEKRRAKSSLDNPGGGSLPIKRHEELYLKNKEKEDKL